MLDVQAKSNDVHIVPTLELLHGILKDYRPHNFAIKLWDSTIWQPEAGQPCRFTLILNHPAALRQMLFPASERRLGEAYMFGDFDIEGDIVEALNLAKYLWENWHWTDALHYAPQFLRLPKHMPVDGVYQAQLSGQQHSLERDKKAIQYHYDVSNEFYQLWLDNNMVYSCAYFASDGEDIDTAQERKLDYICRKLRLKAGERLLDIGCGWGGLLIHAAKHYGVQAVGITLSENQAEFAQQRIAEMNLSKQCRVELLDYRKFEEAQPFDKIVSVGMVEHVGLNNLPTYFEKAYHLLRPGGVFLNHGITMQRAYYNTFNSGRDSFVQHYIFPDGDIQPVDTIIVAAANAGFDIRDLENLQEHYALTLKRWFDRYEANKPSALTLVGRVGYRQWHIYLAAARWLFEYGMLGLHHILLYKPYDKAHRTGVPLTRTDWYPPD